MDRKATAADVRRIWAASPPGHRPLLSHYRHGVTVKEVQEAHDKAMAYAKALGECMDVIGLTGGLPAA